ncbi:helix-turn-helix transcriptional regulator [Nocardia iowensis]|uniref:Helix-turn-helix domain-containing protein n=1 Tax=Nocardia iowensis TaxID=204891 RepID=A0ABX8S2R6_NOCIO|nr:helix-turn-helix domain-containing protein [Nocardia iowensis]QXN95344.1 helix-turn-helix domain-containing protein [Nocardia iowensis]
MSEKEEWLTRQQVADRLGFAVKTLANWASEKKGPPFTKVGRGRCRYRACDVLTWQIQQFGDDVAG